VKHERKLKRGRKPDQAIKFEDFAVANPFVRPWMLPYLPLNPRARDISVLLIGSLLSVVLAAIASLFTSNEFVLVGIALGGSGIFQYDMFWRTLYASRKYREAKHNARK
jgi:hypothetical protein